MGAFVVGWLAGQAIITYRSIRDQDSPPWPGTMLAATGLYAVLAMLGEFGGGARRLAIVLVWGLNIAAFMNLYKLSYLPGGEAPKYWQVIEKTATSGWGNDQILPGGTSTGTGGSGGGAQTPPYIPMPASGNCPPGYNQAYGKCWSEAVNPVPPAGGTLT